jgi:hypothetical protein
MDMTHTILKPFSLLMLGFYAPIPLVNADTVSSEARDEFFWDRYGDLDNSVNLALSFDYMPAAQIEGALGSETAFYSVGISAEAGPLFGSYRNTQFDWKKPENLAFSIGSSDPLTMIHQFDVGMALEQEISEEWIAAGQLGLRSEFEDETEDSFSYYTDLVLFKQLSESWSMTLGGGVEYHDGFGEEFYPLFNFYWNEDASKGFSLAIGFPESSLTYYISPRESIGIEANYQEISPRLSDDKTTPDASYLRFEQQDVGINYMVMSKDRSLVLETGISYLFDRQMDVRNRNGDRTANYDIDETVVLRVELSFLFYRFF